MADSTNPLAPPAPLSDWLLARVAFFLENTSLGSTPLVPEVMLRLAADAVPLWDAIEHRFPSRSRAPPYWGFAWPGGQAVARYVLDHPQAIIGKRILDLASGSGIIAIAAAKVGAARVLAHDIDPLAIVAVAMNADINGVAVEASAIDILRPDSNFDMTSIDVVLAGDLFYDQALAIRAMTFLQRCRLAGLKVLIGDPGRAALPIQLLAKRREYTVPVSAESQYTAAAVCDDRYTVVATVWELETGRSDSAAAAAAAWR